ncbi:MAG: ATP-dependent helicase [Leptolyngbyaceae cyanobacterium bins.59]|nr:ATP-dependent helicase [Leptolyngbyaceae cyanobacterium bins.59]
MQLTEEQQAIVRHDWGPARVFAVAGAGKTTAMVHRVQRLIQEEVFSPDQILATSFSRASVQDIEMALVQWPECATVKTWTLHKLGYYIIRRAKAQGYAPDLNLNLNPEQVNRTLFFQTIAEARRLRVDFRQELEDIDQEDFLTYVSRCKGNLHYADLNHHTFPTTGPHTRIAQQAEPPLEKDLAWYLDLYRLFEEIRIREGAIGFDDMLMTGWELIANYRTLLEEIQHLFECVMVDEFQDVNRAQFAILDLITQSHRNYMVIGDDDQTIYEWRGASSRFILEIFEKRYNPTTYTITDNFRCQASQVALANAVIRKNCNRFPKALSLTQGFTGCTHLRRVDSLEEMGQRIAAQVRSALQSGYRPTDIAILVRVYAQTPYIEQFLIKEEISYWGPDLVPFYQRSEISTFLAFGRLAKLEAQRRRGDRAYDLRQELEVAWNRVKSIPPLRYLSKEVKQATQNTLLQSGMLISETLLLLKSQVTGVETRNKLERLGQWIATAPLMESAEAALRDLDRCINYRDYLKHHSGFPETGQGKAAGVEALIDYAQGKGTLVAFLDYLDQIQQNQSQQQQDTSQSVRLTTIHQAKGLEWSVVIVPNCNQGILPFGEIESALELEEERRLMYVATTRSKRELHLYLLEEKEVSQFLLEANCREVIQQIDRLQKVLSSNPDTWETRDLWELVKGVQQFHFYRYFTHWWEVESSLKESIGKIIQQFLRAVDHQQAWNKLELDREQLTFWQQLVPLDESNNLDFPGLEVFLKQRQGKKSVAKPEKLQSGKVQNSLFREIQKGDRVEHTHFGSGHVAQVINEATSDVITVMFPRYGEKHILVTPDFCALRRSKQVGGAEG